MIRGWAAPPSWLWPGLRGIVGWCGWLLALLVCLLALLATWPPDSLDWLLLLGVLVNGWYVLVGVWDGLRWLGKRWLAQGRRRIGLTWLLAAALLALGWLNPWGWPESPPAAAGSALFLLAAWGAMVRLERNCPHWPAPVLAATRTGLAWR